MKLLGKFLFHFQSRPCLLIRQDTDHFCRHPLSMVTRTSKKIPYQRLNSVGFVLYCKYLSECCSNLHKFHSSTIMQISPAIRNWMNQTQEPICVFDTLRNLSYFSFLCFNLAFFLFFASLTIYYRLSDTLGPLVIAIIEVGKEVMGFMYILIIFLDNGSTTNLIICQKNTCFKV